MSEERKRRVRDTFSKSNQAYVESSTHKNQSDLDLITEWLKPDPKWKILDIATGGGHVAKQLSPSVDTVFATDLTKEMLQNTAKHLSELTNLHYVVADAEELPFIDESFDAVTCRIAPHHFPNPHQFIAEVKRVLKQDGHFLMIDNIAPEDDELDTFYNTFEEMRDPSHVRALKVHEWKGIFEDHGMKVRRELHRKKTLPFPDWVKRTLELEEDQRKVESYFKSANQKVSTYFSINTSANSIESFSIDEWMVLI